MVDDHNAAHRLRLDRPQAPGAILLAQSIPMLAGLTELVVLLLRAGELCTAPQITRRNHGEENSTST